MIVKGQSNNLKLSIIIGSYNSHFALNKNLPILINYLNNQSFDSEVIVVDDGSTDNGATKHLVDQMNCTYIKNDVNMGKGSAIRKGMLTANGQYCIFTDADIPYDTNVIDLMIRYLSEKDYDMVVGDRTLEGGGYFTQVKKIRSVASRFFSWVVGAFIAAGMFDTQCGIKGFKQESAKDLFSVSRINGFAFDVEVFYIALKRNYEIKKVPVKLRSQDGTSVNILKHSIRMILDLPIIILNYYLGKYDKQR